MKRLAACVLVAGFALVAALGQTATLGQAAAGQSATASGLPSIGAAPVPILDPFSTDTSASAGIGSAPAGLGDASSWAAFAMTNPDYPVTPGDVYALSFITAQGVVNSTIIVGLGNSIDMANLGKIDASGLRFVEAKKLIEARVAAAYELSAPQVVIQSCGVFPVYVRGEVGKAATIYCWGLTRLSSLWAGVTAYASYRDVRIAPASGAEKSYDLFRSWRYGDLSQDPYLRPNDLVTFARYDRQVSIDGEVHRPGTYQLLPGQTLKDLVDLYAEGFTDKANPSRITLARNQPSGEAAASKTLLSYADNPAQELRSLDAVNVPSAQELLPVVYFEGALGMGKDGAALAAANRLPYTFMPGETLSQAVQRIKGQFSEVSDLANAYVRRGESRLAVNLGNFIYGKDFTGDMPLLKDDVIVVPFRQFFVSVAGAVMVPGRYPYVPDRTWEYYVGLAGGLDESRNSGERVSIVSLDGAKHGKDRVIQPEDTITASSNSLVYQFGRFSTIVTAIVSVAALMVSLFK